MLVALLNVVAHDFASDFSDFCQHSVVGLLRDSTGPSSDICTFQRHEEFLAGVHQVLIEDPKELEKIRDRESDITKERIQKVLDAGANVVLTTKGIDDMSLKYFVEAGVIACRRVPKEDLRSALVHPYLRSLARTRNATAHYRMKFQQSQVCGDLLTGEWPRRPVPRWC